MQMHPGMYGGMGDFGQMQQMGPPQQFRGGGRGNSSLMPGDWLCPVCVCARSAVASAQAARLTRFAPPPLSPRAQGCGNNNFARRRSCNNCGLERATQSAVVDNNGQLPGGAQLGLIQPMAGGMGRGMYDSYSAADRYGARYGGYGGYGMGYNTGRFGNRYPYM